MGLTDLPEPAAATAARGAQPQGSRPPPSPLAEVDPGEPATAQLIRHHRVRPPWTFSSYIVAAPCLSRRRHAA